MDDLRARLDGLMLRSTALRDDPQHSGLDVLRYLVETTPGSDRMLGIGYAAAKDGRHRDALVTVAIAADAIREAHPGVIRNDAEVLELNKVLQRLFLE